MGILRVEKISKSFGIEQLFTDVSFEVRRGDKMGLIGGNGTGKTTLLRCMLGFESIDSGQVVIPAGETIGYVEQAATLGEGTLYEELCGAFRDVLDWHADMQRLEQAIATEAEPVRQSELMRQYGVVVEKFERAGGYEYENRIRRVAFGLGFTDADFPRRVDAFSGGQKTRIGLARALIRQPDFLFLDEPTNHLDIAMVEWLEEFLLGYPGGIIIVSHDRYFLDRVVGRILELEHCTLAAYKGSYTQYLVQKAERMAALATAYEKQQAFIAKTEDFIDRYRAGVKSKQARGREKRLGRLERIVLPPAEGRFDFFVFNPPGECADRVAELEEVATAYGSREVFQNVSLSIRRGDGVALVGPNGAGKTTLLKLLTGELSPTAGKVKLGNRVKIGYFAQEHENLNPQNRLVDELNQEYGLSEERSRHYLGAFLFRGDDVFKRIGDLSGGEKARVAMLKLMLAGANFLVLDEPTNHLDIPAKEAVEEAIMTFPGTFLTVSHDRYFLDKVANCVVELDANGLTEYSGNYSDYRERKVAVQKAMALQVAAEVKVDTKSRNPAHLRQRKTDATKLLKTLENKIAELEEKIAELEVRLNDPASHADPLLSRELAEEHALLQEDLETTYDQWLELQSTSENAEIEGK